MRCISPRNQKNGNNMKMELREIVDDIENQATVDKEAESRKNNIIIYRAEEVKT